jgi:phytoene dehydrogenase-like protein
LIEDLAQGVREFTRFDMSTLLAKPQSLMGVEDWREFGQKMTPFLLPLAKWVRLSAEDFGAKFTDPFLRRAFPQAFAWPEIPMMAVLSLLASMHTSNAGFPAGASLEFARAIERRYLELGGEIYYKSQVEEILVENKRAVGVRLYNDEIHYADYVISAADGHSTIFDMLGGEFVNQQIEKLYSPGPPANPFPGAGLFRREPGSLGRAALDHLPAGQTAADRRGRPPRDRHQELLL